jgi:hypothetical protein
MSKAKGEQTPTESVASVQDTASQLDARGRRITVKRLNALDYYRLTKVMGRAASNEATMGMAMLAVTVRRIDTQDIAMPASEKDVEFLMQQLDFDGIAAAGEALKQLNRDPQEDEEAAKN